ncbi:uncharacterized protein BX663DRAFT_515090 [Cokeromyces recurvatus]|uniref:uncharacterized protein n=1 Tax=Cokeromyces recurvatus TaxID=90255 RepID=UPI00221F69A1|nr:uncharacterized protein BX663DRAFT_515090 [Cokeromyces recurvatus]KAI7901144.1 hypothetical protein BX663DRAFT_515090 [Cokeromyces recurvatus]
MFPKVGYFYIKSQKTGFVISTNDEDEAGTKLVIKSKNSGTDYELWSFESGYLVNKMNLFVMDIQGGDIRSGQNVLQYERKKTMAHNQRWGLRDGFIYVVADPRIVLESTEEEESYLFVNARKLEDNDFQQWYIEPYTEEY